MCVLYDVKIKKFSSFPPFALDCKLLVIEIPLIFVNTIQLDLINFNLETLDRSSVGFNK